MIPNLLKNALRILGAALLIAATAGAQQPGTENSNPNQMEQQGGSGGAPGELGMSPNGPEHVDVQAMQDRFFVTAVLRGSIIDTRLARLALAKSSSSDVKQFAQKVIDDSGGISADVGRAGRQSHIHPSAKLSDKEKAVLARLQGLSGEQFDRAYIRLMVRHSKGADEGFKIEAERAETPALQQAAGRGEPVIASHLEAARQLAAAYHVWAPKAPAAASNP